MSATPRLWLALGLFGEAALLSLLGTAVLGGRLPATAGFYLVLLGGLGAGALTASWAAPRRAATAVTHGALLTGCLVFSFPFVWLVSTSLKYDEEIFVYPPRWVPEAPPAVLQSPYLTAESLPPLAAPEGLAPGRWAGLWERLQPTLAHRCQALLGVSLPGDAATAEAALAHSLFQRAAAGLPGSLWVATDDSIITAVLGRIDAVAAASAWEAVSRSLALRPITVIDDAGNLHAPARTGPFDPWTTTAGTIQMRADSSASSRASLTLAYDLTQTKAARIQAELPLPVPESRFVGLILPIRQDRTWHALEVGVELPGGRYEAAEALYLGQYRWQELGFKLAERDPRDERDVGTWPLVRTAAAGGPPPPPGYFRVTLTVDRAWRPAAVWRKYTASFRSAWIATQHRWRYVGNSLYLVLLAIAGQTLSCSLVAYAFARLHWPGRDALFAVLLATMMLPGQVTMIPVFMVFRELGWYNSLKPLWVPSFLGSAFFIFMLRQFMRSIPVELEEAARIDGCSRLGIYWRIILPLVKPALAAVGIFTFMGTWNDFMGPLIYVNDQRLYPLALGLFDFRTEHSSEFGMLMAASTLMTAPVVALFFAAQRYFIEGVTLTGIKG
jgi:ABC-type glycerol-3-phosphate transport system permease component